MGAQPLSRSATQHSAPQLLTLSLLVLSLPVTCQDVDTPAPQPPDPSAPLVSWAGSLTPTSIRLAVQPAPETGTLLVSKNPDLSAPLAEQVVTNEVFIAQVRGLEPETRYYYGLREADTQHVGTFLTPSTSNEAGFRVAFGGSTWTGNEDPVFANIARLSPRPLAFVHLGDLHHYKIDSNSPKLFEDAYHEVHSSGTQSELFRKVPIMYTWDANDFGASDGKQAALDMYRKYVPANLSSEYLAPQQEADEWGVHQKYEIQGVLFILTDARTYRDTVENTMLGAQQLNWLLDLLERWQEWRLIIWVSSAQWLGTEGDGWSAFPEERLLISTKIAEFGVRNLIMVAGDSHMLAIDDGSNTDFAALAGNTTMSDARAGFPLLQAGPLTGYGTASSGPYSHGCMAYEFFLNHQFGIIDIEEGDSSRLCVDIQGYTRSGARLWKKIQLCASDNTPWGLVRRGIRRPGEGEVEACELHFAPNWILATMIVGAAILFISLVYDFSLCLRVRRPKKAKDPIVDHWLNGGPDGGPESLEFKVFGANGVKSFEPQPLFVNGRHGHHHYKPTAPHAFGPLDQQPPSLPRQRKRWPDAVFKATLGICHVIGIILIGLSLGIAIGPKARES